MDILSSRLKAIADFVPNGSVVADIGTDHAFLPTYLVKTGTSPRVVAGEYNEGPFLSAKRQVAKEGLQQQIDVRRGNGLEVIEPGDGIQVITISGMGGALIAEILERGNQSLENVNQLILQPNVGEDIVRRWLEANNWHLKSEKILEEDGKIYEVLVAVRERMAEGSVQYQHPVLSTDWVYRLGPYLISENSPLLAFKWERELELWRRISTQIKQSDSEEAVSKYAEMEDKIKQLEGIITWLKTGIPLSKH